MRKLFFQIRRCNWAPLEWRHSQAALVQKCNGKVGPASYRQIHLLDPVGKCYYRGLWDRAPFHGEAGHFSTAYLPYRRREQSMAQQRIVLHRLTAAKLSHGLLIYDIRNAFPSVSHDTLDQAIDDSFEQEVHMLMIQRYRNSTTTANAADGPCTYIIGSGNLQGDSIAALQFAEVYTPCLYNYLNLKHIQPWGRKLLLRDWLTGDLVDAGFTNYADDIADIIFAEDCETLCERRVWANSILEEAIAPAGLSTSTDKTTFLPHMCGRGSKTAMATFFQNQPPFNKTVKFSAAYLGAQVSIVGTNTLEVRNRIAAAERAWFAASRVWRMLGVSLKFRLQLFASLVMTTLLTGLEALVLAPHELHRLETCRMTKVRRLLGYFSVFSVVAADDTVTNHYKPYFFAS
ncbi:unnamed protein product [Polarella glacialis]|uniref:Reverse transcriptase domain-containing protein n=1 Tax=Polarella glacialis TaxID=89957 RepID=A0A813DPG4_POLGL|nr:unnamed protein product [Polarella glacialis]